MRVLLIGVKVLKLVEIIKRKNNAQTLQLPRRNIVLLNLVGLRHLPGQRMVLEL